MAPEIEPGLVSVIVPVFNRPAMLARAVESVEAQTYGQVELILVDDGSTDETAALCDELAQSRAGFTTTIHSQNGGPGAAREAGRRMARGEFIQYLDSDDWIAPNKIDRQVEELRRAPVADLCYCATVETLEWDPTVRRIRGRTGEGLDSIFPHLLQGRLWPTHSPIYRRAFSDRLGPWTSLRQEEDIEYDARAGRLGAKLAYVPEVLAEQRHHRGERAGGGSNRDKDRMRCRAESHRLVLGHARAAGIDHSSAAMQCYARELFHLSRQCGAIGLDGESRGLFELAREASGPERGEGLDFRAYGLFASMLGWETAGRLAGFVEGLRGKGVETPA